MQERYLGDSHDYLKYALLRALHAAGLGRIALAWYLTSPAQVDRPGNGDGEKRHHIKGKEWIRLDAPLLEGLEAFQDPAARSIAAFEASDLLPRDTIYTARDVPSLLSARQSWWHGVMADCADAEIVFCDPDNGFEVPSATARTRPKYALYDEARALAHAGKIVINIQFARQCDPILRAHATRDRLAEGLAEHAALPVLRGRVAPNILFLFMAPPARQREIHATLERLCARLPGRLQLIP